MGTDAWAKYKDLSEERLQKLGDLVRSTRKKCADLHEPSVGDSAWSLGCRAYSRACYAIRNSSYEWLKVLPDHQYLRLTFTVGNVPIRMYRGDPDDPPSRTLVVSYPELEQRQYAFDFVGAPLDKTLRLAIETDGRGYVSLLTLVELDEDGNVFNTYPMPAEATQTNIVDLRPKPIDLPALTVEPLIKNGHEDEQQKRVG